MVSATIILIGVVVLLLVLNFIVSRLPKKNQQVKVAFIPPSTPVPSSDDGALFSSDFMGQISGHMQATNVKISQLFSRMEGIEKRMGDLEETFSTSKEETWIETVPVRNKKK